MKIQEEDARRSLLQAAGKAWTEPRSGEAQLGAPPSVGHDWTADHAQPIQCGVRVSGMHSSLDQLSASPYTGGPALCTGDPPSWTSRILPGLLDGACYLF